MDNILIFLYIANATLLINHEIDSAYWKEWNLFRLPGGITGFLIIHFPLLFLILYGLVLLMQNNIYGLLVSLLLSFGGLFAFFAHSYFLIKGRKEFRNPISIFILGATLLVSIIQGVFIIRLLI